MPVEKSKVDGRSIVRCSWSRSDVPDPQRCGWTGRADKYQKHLDQFHGGKDFVPEPVGIIE